MYIKIIKKMTGLINDLNQRLDRVRAELEKNKLDALLVSNAKNMLYLTGKDTGKALIMRDQAILWIKDIYAEIYPDIYSHSNYGFTLAFYEKDAIKNFIDKAQIKRLGIEDIRVMDYQRLAERVKAEVFPCDIVERLRSVKSRYEIKLLQRAAEMAKEGMKKAYETVTEGTIEIEAVAEIEARIRRLGSETPPFESGMLLSSGESGADIHCHAQTKKIRSGSLVVVDLGGRYQGYHSDMTRTLTVDDANREEKDLLEFIENLELETIDRIEVGVKASEVHEMVEKKIREKGFSFYHSTGHGVGLDVHEKPNIGSDSDDILGEGMVFTIEPGIYVPHRFGIRFEDTVLLRKNKKDLLTR